MREDKQTTSPKTWVDQKWFWPAVYAIIAIIMIAFIVLYNVLVTPEESDTLQPVSQEPETIIETNAVEETMKFPFDELQLNNVKILQDFYDVTADAETRENALLVFNQTYSASNGVSIAINSEPFQVLAALSGTVTEVKLDAFTGNKVTIEHENGYTTQYTSVGDIVVQEGDNVVQGEPIGMTVENEWNPTAGIHLHFEVLKDGQYINPRTLLAF
ncbi:peptidoglycan DD-metalloendopeptidase family protein [Lysinibacillus sp. LZ02]|uniref:peptidoglycan DD-metalloendopeptidase family protein n=1 Tax=Lysinibacillus sp. LZ02 TaxID=3420668 RepID=UPI003D35F962